MIIIVVIILFDLIDFWKRLDNESMIRNIEIELLLESKDLELKDQSGLDRWSVSFEANLTKTLS